MKQDKKAAELPKPLKSLFKKVEVSSGWSNITQEWTTGSGFHNVGNSSYLNATLQAIFHVPSFVHWLLSDKKHRKKGICSNENPCIICAMFRTLNDTQQQQFTATPSLIADRLKSSCQHLLPGRQEDAHEFLRFLIDQMTESFLHRCIDNITLDQYSKETTALNQIFGGYFRSTIVCESCGHESETFEHFMELALNISKADKLHQAIDSFFTRENLEEQSYECSQCNKKVSATKLTLIERTPVVLCVQLKRFDADGHKVCKGIQIPLHVDLSAHLFEHSEHNQRSYYKLVSLVTHIGISSSRGHYSAVGLAPKGLYYEFNDSSVKEVKINEVLRSSDAYLIFYEAVPSNISTANIQRQPSKEEVKQRKMEKAQKQLELLNRLPTTLVGHSPVSGYDAVMISQRKRNNYFTVTPAKMVKKSGHRRKLQDLPK